MTSSKILHAVIPLVADLAQELPERERLRRLLAALRTLLPADAVALLRLNGEWLEPVAIDGLVPDTLGRRFKVAEHPRLAQLLAAGQAMRFAPDSPLPDPYDGLITTPGELHVHDCMGCVLQTGGLAWGLLTLDALEPDRFAGDNALELLQAFSNLAAATVATAERVQQLSQAARSAAAPAPRSPGADRSRQILGTSPAIRQLQGSIALVAASDLCVLITGETGTGKEVAAHALHRLSARNGKPFQAINCGAIPSTLIQSELFGHERGAFTGATSRRQGLFETAHNGSVFLDEIGDLPLDAQTSLLRVLQEGTIERVGSNQPIPVDVRILAATHVDLERAVEEGRFRRDLYYRLNVLRLAMPPLRKRDGDIELLSRQFLRNFRMRHPTRARGYTTEARQAMDRFPWPGNVRELLNRVQRAAITAEGELISSADLELNLSTDGAQLNKARNHAERETLLSCLQQSQYNISACARLMKVSRVTIYRMCRKHQLELEALR